MERSLRQILYFSIAAGCQDAATVAAIWALSRDRYQRQGLSGLMVAGGHRYLELLEGPAGAVEDVLERVRLDPRHVGVSVLVARRIAARAFPDWSATYFTAPKCGRHATLGEMLERLGALSPDDELRLQLDRIAARYAPVPPSSRWTRPSSYVGALPLDRRH